MQKGKFIQIIKVIDKGDNLPPTIAMIHRHFEKSKPTVSGSKTTLNAPVDLLNVMIPGSILDQVESLEVIYDKTGSTTQ